MTVRRGLVAAAGLGLAALPWLVGPYALLTVTAALALGLFALSFDLVLGVTGLVSVSHATLFGVGGYGMAIGMTRLSMSPPAIGPIKEMVLGLELEPVRSAVAAALADGQYGVEIRELLLDLAEKQGLAI